MSCEKCEDHEIMEEIICAIKNGSNSEQYETIKKFKKQLENCLDDILRYREEMVKKLKECEGKDAYKDSKVIQSCLKTIMDYAMLEKANADTIIKTIECILGELYWTK